jgi:hypothetical protein
MRGWDPCGRPWGRVVLAPPRWQEDTVTLGVGWQDAATPPQDTRNGMSLLYTSLSGNPIVV